MDIYLIGDVEIALVYSRLGEQEKYESILEKFREYAENNISIYRHLSLCAYCSYNGNTENALEQYRIFPGEYNFHY